MSEKPAQNPLPEIDIEALYATFDLPVTGLDCGQKCAPFNPRGIPFCCDICQAVPVAYLQEWAYLRGRTQLWHEWRGDECPGEPQDPAEVLEETPEHLLLMACKGPAYCERQFRSSGCRQFPFFPYITLEGDFIGLAYEWEFEESCWVLSHLDQVSDAYRRQFVDLYSRLFSIWQEEFKSYYFKSEDIRSEFCETGRKIILLHRDGGIYFLDPDTDEMQVAKAEDLPRFGPYADAED